MASPRVSFRPGRSPRIPVAPVRKTGWIRSLYILHFIKCNLGPPKMADSQGLGFRTKREAAIDTLREAISSGRYVPGQSLRQIQLVQDLGLGSAPVREAVLELLARGVLVQESHRTVRV